MYFADYHIHTNFSGDCNTPMEDIVKKAVSLGLKEIAITDHVDYDFPVPEFTFTVDYDEYLNDFNRIKEKYKNCIDILLGVEIGFQPHIKEKLEELCSKYPFDFVICSTHAADNLDLYNGDFFKDKNQNYAYLRYFENVLENVKTYSNYDVYGHMDYIIRYGEYENKTLSYNDYMDIINTILKAIIHSGCGIEINTSGYRYGLGQMHPQFDILKKYKELGGEIVTVGSDSHTTKDLCSNFNLAYDALKSAGFNHITTFRNRKPKFVDIA